MLALLSSILVIHLFALMSPGPDFVFVTRTAIVESCARALLGVAGIVAGQIIWSGLSLLGLDMLFQRFAGLQQIIAFAGGCYLLWMAFGILRSVWLTLRVLHEPREPQGPRLFREHLLDLRHARRRYVLAHRALRRDDR